MQILIRKLLLLTTISLIILSLSLGTKTFANEQQKPQINSTSYGKDIKSSNLLAKGQRYVPPESDNKDNACS